MLASTTPFVHRGIVDVPQGVHPRIIADGLELAKQHVIPFLEKFAIQKPEIWKDRELLCNVARTSLRTKLHQELADQLTEIVTDAVLIVHKPGEPIDLHMIERMHMLHRTDRDSKLVRGIVMDHGARHPDMPSYLENCWCVGGHCCNSKQQCCFATTCIATLRRFHFGSTFSRCHFFVFYRIMIGNFSLEYEKAEHNSTFVYSTAGEREKLVEAERKFTDEKVCVAELKRCALKPASAATTTAANDVYTVIPV